MPSSFAFLSELIHSWIFPTMAVGGITLSYVPFISVIPRTYPLRITSVNDCKRLEECLCVLLYEWNDPVVATTVTYTFVFCVFKRTHSFMIPLINGCWRHDCCHQLLFSFIKERIFLGFIRSMTAGGLTYVSVSFYTIEPVAAIEKTRTTSYSVSLSELIYLWFHL